MCMLSKTQEVVKLFSSLYKYQKATYVPFKDNTQLQGILNNCTQNASAVAHTTRIGIGRSMLGRFLSFAGRYHPVGKCARIQQMQVIIKKAQTDLN